MLEVEAPAPVALLEPLGVEAAPLAEDGLLSVAPADDPFAGAGAPALPLVCASAIEPSSNAEAAPAIKMFLFMDKLLGRSNDQLNAVDKKLVPRIAQSTLP